MLPRAWNGLYNWTCSLYLCCQEEKGATEDEMVGWHHWLDGYEFEQTLGDGEGQGSLACYSPWGCRVGHNWETEQQTTMSALRKMGDTCSRADHRWAGRRAAHQLSLHQISELAASWTTAHGASSKELPGQVRASLVPGAAVRCAPSWAEDAMMQSGACSLLALLRLNDCILTKSRFNS